LVLRTEWDPMKAIFDGMVTLEKGSASTLPPLPPGAVAEPPYASIAVSCGP